MDRIQRKNLREIEGLNQRGGRTLSFVDLIRAGTMSDELVAYCWTAIAHGASFLTAARPGGAGKSTVLANLLCLLPPNEEIVTVTDPDIVDDSVPNCYLAHEIGSGHWYGYIWASQVRDFMALMARGSRIASCLHADYLDETRSILTAPPLEVPLDHFSMLDLLLFVHVAPGNQRRVATAYESGPEGHQLVFEWDRDTDRLAHTRPSALLTRLGAQQTEYEGRLQTVRNIVREGDADFAVVRQKVLAEY